MNYEYDNSMHAHIGYYEDGYDVEVVAYKRKNEDVWDVFFSIYVVWTCYRDLAGE